MINTDLEMNRGISKDPDSYSEVLFDYHYKLWSDKAIDKDNVFRLVKTDKKPYRFSHECENENYYVSSDSIIHSYLKWNELKHLNLSHESDFIKEFRHLSLTIGGYMIFPGNRINNKPTINALRGINKYIKDRFDLTLECIRRWYLGMESPLFDVIERYNHYFLQFGNFRTFCKFFYIDHLTDQNENILFWLPFNNFSAYAELPKTLDQYKDYMKKVIDFVRVRNNKMSKYKIINL